MSELDPERRAELGAMLVRMRDAAELTYASMQITQPSIGDWCPRYLQHTMLMSEFAKICEDALARGIDFALAPELPVQGHRAKYLLEKLERLYGRQTLRALLAGWLAELERDEPSGG
jgi:hypothetical protein